MPQPAQTSKIVVFWSRYGLVVFLALLVVFSVWRGTKFGAVLLGATVGGGAVVGAVVVVALACYGLLWILQKWS